MAATPKPIRKSIKKMGTEARAKTSGRNKSVNKNTQSALVKKAKSEGKRKRSINFIKSQY